MTEDQIFAGILQTIQKQLNQLIAQIGDNMKRFKDKDGKWAWKDEEKEKIIPEESKDAVEEKPKKSKKTKKAKKW